MAGPDWQALARAVLARRGNVASLNCPAVPPLRSETPGHLAENGRKLLVSGVPLGSEMIAQAGHPAGRGTGAGTLGVPHCPGGVPGGGTERDREADRLLRLAVLGAAALTEPDPALDEERAVIAAARAAEAAGEVPAKPEADHRRHLAGLERSALMRPSSWVAPAALPSRGAYCGCCSRHRPEAGGRWWAPVEPQTDGLGVGPGWACVACHPPPGCDVWEVRT
jgi:hypothetical protein